jgi:hypothetical protein
MANFLEFLMFLDGTNNNPPNPANQNPPNQGQANQGPAAPTNANQAQLQQNRSARRQASNRPAHHTLAAAQTLNWPGNRAPTAQLVAYFSTFNPTFIRENRYFDNFRALRPRTIDTSVWAYSRIHSDIPDLPDTRNPDVHANGWRDLWKAVTDRAVFVVNILNRSGWPTTSEQDFIMARRFFEASIEMRIYDTAERAFQSAFREYISTLPWVPANIWDGLTPQQIPPKRVIQMPKSGRRVEILNWNGVYTQLQNALGRPVTQDEKDQVKTHTIDKHQTGVNAASYTRHQDVLSTYQNELQRLESCNRISAL